MNRKILAISFVLMMCLTSIAVLAAQSDDASADERTGTIHPYSGGRGSSSKVYCSTESMKYMGPGYGDFSESYIYYATNPNEIIEKYAKGETSSIGDYVVYDDLVKNRNYWAVSTYNSYGGMWTWNAYNLRMETIYLPAGTYEIEFTSTNMSGTRCSLYDFTSTHYFNEFKDGNGTVKVPLTEPGSFYVSAYSNDRTTAASLAWTLNYRITPAPPEQRTVTCEKDISVGTDKVWVWYKAETLLPADRYYVSMYSSEDYCYIVRGSTEETSFLANVVDKGLTDYSAYMKEYIDLDGSTYVDVYTIGNVGDNYNYSRSFSLEKRNYFNPLDPHSGYSTDYVNVECRAEQMTESTDFTFYASQNFSVAVDFDPSEYSYVILRSGTMYVCMDPKKLYTVKAESASEYQIFAKLADGSTASINSANIKYHTEDVADPDNAGMTFAVVSIGFCAIAFFLLFYFGRRPKWDDSTGLPLTGAVETVVNDVPEVPEEEPEAPAEEAPPEQPPEE